MTLFIQRAEHRDTQAIHAKLDELLHVHGKASNALTRLDDKEPEDIERHREQARTSSTASAAAWCISPRCSPVPCSVSFGPLEIARKRACDALLRRRADLLEH